MTVPIIKPRLVNLTGHNIILSDGVDQVEIHSEGRAKMYSKKETVNYVEVGGFLIPVVSFVESELRGLPEPEKDVIYVVSGVVAAAANRPDVVNPGQSRREGNGRVSMAKALIRPINLKPMP